MTNPVTRYHAHQDSLTGLFGNINIPYKKVKALKKNKQWEYYYNLKLVSAVDKTKFVSAIAEGEASYYVAPLREARDILEGYVEAIQVAIATCRSHIWEFKGDKSNDVN